MSNKVTYDSAMHGDGKPYRSEALYRPDLATVMSRYKNRECQVIAEHGDTEWTNAVWEHYEGVADIGAVRFHVTTTDGRALVISEDRIRIRP